jgi:hypothetical protein
VIAAGGFVSIENGIKRGSRLAVSRNTGEHKTRERQIAHRVARVSWTIRCSVAGTNVN